MFRHARLRDAIRPRWQVIASERQGSIEVSWSKNDWIASTNPATGTYCRNRFTIGGPWRPTRQLPPPRRPTRQRGSPSSASRFGGSSARRRSSRAVDHARVVPAPPADQGRARPDRANHGDRALRSPAARPEQRHGAGVPAPARLLADALLFRREGCPPAAQRAGEKIFARAFRSLASEREARAAIAHLDD